MGFSEKLTTLRKQAGLSQEQLADRLGVTRQSVSKWESGAALPELVKLIALSEMFGVSLDYLVKDCVEEPKQAEKIGADTARLERKLDALTSAYRGSWGPITATPARPAFLVYRWYPSALAGTGTLPGTVWRWESLRSAISQWAW